MGGGISVRRHAVACRSAASATASKNARTTSVSFDDMSWTSASISATSRARSARSRFRPSADRVKAFMGHADISTTMMYAHHVSQHDAAERLSAVLRAASSVASVAPEVSEPRPSSRAHRPKTAAWCPDDRGRLNPLRPSAVPSARRLKDDTTCRLGRGSQHRSDRAPPGPSAARSSSETPGVGSRFASGLCDAWVPDRIRVACR